MKHVCRKDGRPIGPLDGPAWAAPGELVKLTDQEHWGRVELLWRCCGTYGVRVEGFGDREPGVFPFRIEELENVYEAWPLNFVPRGYPVPSRTGGLRRA